MAFEWNRVRLLATDGDKSIWTYATNHVARDCARMHDDLPRYPRHELIPSKAGISIIFHGGDIMEKLIRPLREIGATFDRISDTILAEGMETPVAKQGNPNEQVGRADHRPNDADRT